MRAGAMRSIPEVPAGAKAQDRRAEYLACAYRCSDMAGRTGDPHDAQFLQAMMMVWQILAGRDATSTMPLPLERITDARRM
jgi:hypothetical protein